MWIKYKCTECRTIQSIYVPTIEKSINANPHNPIEQFLICPECTGLTDITSKRLSITYDGNLGYLYVDADADGELVMDVGKMSHDLGELLKEYYEGDECGFN